MSDPMRRSGINPDAVLCSPALRAKQTLLGISAALPNSAEVLVEASLYEAGASQLFLRVQQVDDTIGEVLLIGHNPALHDLAVELAVEGDEEIIARGREVADLCAGHPRLGRELVGPTRARESSPAHARPRVSGDSARPSDDVVELRVEWVPQPKFDRGGCRCPRATLRRPVGGGTVAVPRTGAGTWSYSMGGQMVDKDMLQRLRSVPLFEGMSDKELQDILGRTRVVEHQGGEIVEEGAGAVGFHLILDGTATVLQGAEVRRTLGPGDYFGEISMIDGKPRSATVRPEGTVRTLSLAAWNFAPLLDAHPSMARKMLLGLCQHLRAAEARSA